ncbi:AraC family transcriptional regulator [Burkholderia ubonensis]|nr:AraC family transcriptional regulator [Burkholderia ubonensis]KWB30403.1 AraC family transcriptional regulator [Burkholderia ubonensis]
MERTATPYTADLSNSVQTDPPPVNRRFECNDVDSLAEWTSGWSVQLQLDQLSPGSFHGKIHEVRFDDLQLLRERANRALLKRGSASSHRTSFSIPLATVGAGYCGGALLPPKTLLVSNCTTLPELRTPGNYDTAILTVLTQTLQALASIDELTDRQILSNDACLLALPESHYERLRAFLAATFTEIGAAESLLAWLPARKALHDTLLLELTSALSDTTESFRLAHTARRRIVDRVRELVIETPDVPFTVLDICRVVGTSRRKLQYCFEEILGTHPAYYLRVVRLNAVRRTLREHSPATASVSDVAFQWGFWHLSRFATHYRQLFGELPSDTLRRPPP